MAQTKNLGKVTITPRGAYSSGSAYERLDIVTYAGGSWIALQDVQGVTPSAGPYWALLTSKGDKGDTGQAATVAVGTVTTLSPGAQATVTNSGTQNNAVLNFGIPQGPAGNVSSVDGVSPTGGNVPLNAVVYGSVMSLTPTEQQNVLDSIGAAAAADLSNYIPTSQKGAASGVATLDADGKVTADQLSPSIIWVYGDRTLQLSDAGQFLNFSSSSSITVTIPTNTSVAFPVGTEITAYRGGTGTVTFTGESGVTIRSVNSSKKIGNQYGIVRLNKLNANVWVISGDL